VGCALTAFLFTHFEIERCFPYHFMCLDQQFTACPPGLIQLAFTVFTVLLSWPMYHSYRLSLLWQVVKIGVSLYYGSRMQCQVLPDRLGKLLIERHVAEQSKLALSVTHQPDEPQKQDQQQEEVQGAKCAE